MPEDGEALQDDGAEIGSQNNSQEKEETEKRENWEYISDRERSHKSFADAGFLAVTVCQDIAWEQQPQSETDIAQEAKTADIAAENIDTEKLRSITDILAAAVGQIMIE